MEGCVLVEESFLRNVSWQIKLFSEFSTIHNLPDTNDSGGLVNHYNQLIMLIYVN